MHEMRRSDKEIHSQAEIDEILEAGEVCHLALKDEPFPYVVPLNYGYGRMPESSAATGAVEPGATMEGRGAPALFFHGAAAGRKIDLMKRDPRVAFVVDVDHELITDDEACRFTMYYRSVMGTGHIRFLETPAEKRYAMNRVMRQYSGRDDWSLPDRALQAMAIYALVIEEMGGKRSPGKS
ncbi:MAG: pyridoxamine 5'-phosphate oxidase family protein [Spirochaetia bacterium]